MTTLRDILRDLQFQTSEIVKDIYSNPDLTPEEVDNLNIQKEDLLEFYIDQIKERIIG